MFLFLGRADIVDNLKTNVGDAGAICIDAHALESASRMLGDVGRLDQSCEGCGGLALMIFLSMMSKLGGITLVRRKEF